MGTSLERVLDRAENRRGSGSNLLVSCPVPSHGQRRGDRNPSLHVTYDGVKTLLACQVGCHVQDVLVGFGLEFADLFDEPPHKTLVASYTYCQPNGEPYQVAERWETEKGKTFMQRLPGADKPGLPAGFKPCLYRLPQVLAQVAAHGVVYVVEGEKCVHAAEHLGLVATTGPNGAKGWRDYYARWLRGASEVVVVTDNDEPGRVFAAAVCASIRSHGIPCRTMGVAVGGDKADLYDHVLAGYTAKDLVPVNLNRLRPKGNMMNDLLNRSFKPVRWAVTNLIPSGLTLLGAPPKSGKSFMALDIALGVACGKVCLSTLRCEQGDVLYLSLDNDSERRLADRTTYIFSGDPPADLPMEVHLDWPTGLAALAACQEWAAEQDNPRLIVMDTLIRVEPALEGDGTRNTYAASVEAMSRWAQFAIEADIAVLAVHHDRKAEAEDWLNRFTGSRGITATAQTLLMIDSKRGTETGTLRVSGRDLETDDLELRRMGRTWVCLDPPRPTAQGLAVVN